MSSKNALGSRFGDIKRQRCFNKCTNKYGPFECSMDCRLSHYGDGDCVLGYCCCDNVPPAQFIKSHE
ncbi:hypothetical protein EUTSA_v10021891mg [Eutrema salsugineum]|uniref:Defensin-like domain-containing protein n=1 Tax=Eutrema salsugineum TaxID=72664 RepID=V4MB43_EUTSA|nr:hypothetical protein EUTSA_v10021891mg [Eutrema salsugineum]